VAYASALSAFAKLSEFQRLKLEKILRSGNCLLIKGRIVVEKVLNEKCAGIKFSADSSGSRSVLLNKLGKLGKCT
jgi:hypothetical protein